ncbi:DUF4129 domain-containing protein [Natrinema halophilum]|uniref:Protein-glutamine gamma-glutamyltransferase-like C-terminal domain-containing protein n=1 Tax=Natrinema halophilum TaxID=1699371 RepID=A0A7D5GI90_9EURY|nr:DUF4129 domain-containing protein [Natrinema halophilum]QLG49487.1 hypothetical protein HYG82_11750 [Natrinema halophilum]
MAPLTAASPASDVFEDLSGDRISGGSTELSPAAGISGSGGIGESGGGSGGSAGTGGSLLGSSLLDEADVSGSPLFGSLFGELMALSNGGGGFGGELAGGDSETASNGEGNGPDSDATDGGGEAEKSSLERDRTGGNDGQSDAPRSESGPDSAGSNGQTTTNAAESGSSLTDSVSELSGYPVVAVLAVISLLLVGYLFFIRDEPISTLLSILARLVSFSLAGVVACSRAIERGLVALRRVTSIAELPGLVLTAITNVIRSIGERVRDAGSSAALVLLGNGEDDGDAAAALEERAAPRERIRQAFESVINASPMYRRRVATTTPKDVARSATNAGAPADPVETITDSFRDVEYGDRDPDSYLERTKAAHDRLRDALDATSEGGDDELGTVPETEDGTDE